MTDNIEMIDTKMNHYHACILVDGIFRYRRAVRIRNARVWCMIVEHAICAGIEALNASSLHEARLYVEM